MTKKAPTESANDGSPIVRANLNRVVTNAPGFVSLYANDVQVQITPWDVRLTLGQIGDVASDGEVKISVQQIADVRLSPQLAKKLTIILLGQLQAYEERLGPIPQPTDD